MLFLVGLISWVIRNLTRHSWSISFNNLYGQNEPQKLPGVLANEPEEKSFAGQIHTNIRLPFGGNPQQHTIGSVEVFAKKSYHDAYQKNIFNVQPTGTPDWRMDQDFLSEINNYNEYMIPEPREVQHIKRFSQKYSSKSSSPLKRKK